MTKSAYIHIPFCKQICSYCDFCKVYYNEKWIMDYLDALKKEIKQNYNNDLLETIYIGGGTPSSLNVEELNKLFNILELLKLKEDNEFTIECNIEDITEEKLKLFKEKNINRLSIGVQTFNDKFLKYLGRTYDGKIAIERIKLAKKYFDNVNIDIIYALEGQTIEDLKKDLDIILSLDINHVSCYSLIIEKNTKLYLNGAKQIDEDLDFEMYKLIENKLSGKLNRYEISNYSKKGYESKHNMRYWLNEEYYGFGLSAAGYIKNNRYINTKNLSKYISNFTPTIEKVSKNDKIKYELILGFRLIEGINKERFYNKYNIKLSSVDNINELIKKGYLLENEENIYVNKEYSYLLNEILINFI